jgi:hypothetical protein
VGVSICRQCEPEEALLKLVPDIVEADPLAAALLVECRGQTKEDLQVRPAVNRQRISSMERDGKGTSGKGRKTALRTNEPNGSSKMTGCEGLGKE